MSKIIDITDKLDFESNPTVVVKGVELEINANASDLFSALAIVQSGDTSPKTIQTLVEILFPSEETREKIRGLNLKPKTYEKFVFECAKIAFDNYDDTEGEAQTPATT